jgi:hypothetical protein
MYAKKPWWPWHPQHCFLHAGSPVEVVLARMEGRREDLVGLGNPSNEVEMEIFYASTTITLDNGENAPFWEAP